MATFEDLLILKAAEKIADSVWKQVSQWDEFSRDVVGKQITRSADSIGANIAESFGRYHFGEKLQFLYYSRGSLFETKYWLNRVKERDLMKQKDIQEYIDGLTSLARQLNSFANGLKNVRSEVKKPALKEPSSDYHVTSSEEFSGLLFSEEDLAFLEG
ncbi:hypothetical protein MASR2M66_28840 [Chloroflexota bacterium]